MPLLTSFTGALLALLLDGPFNYEFSRVTDEKGQAHLVLRANENLPQMEVTIVGDRQTIKRQLPPLKVGKEHKIVWVQNNATAAYEVKIVAGSSEAETGFEVTRATGKPVSGAAGKISALATAEDLVFKHQSIYQTNFDVTSYKFEVYDTDGAVIHTDNGDQAPFKAGDRVVLKWDSPNDVFLVKVRFDGEGGQYGEHILAPMAIDIPHTEVVFDSGKALIKGEQSPKLDEAAAVAMNKLASVENAKAAVGKMMGDQYVAKLFISGYTDTVGSPGDNQKLSQQRAKAIADYFHSKGVWSEIYFTGMGERGLKVQTADNVDEEKNRRAVYVISFEPPTGAWFPAPGAWKKAAGARQRPKTIPPYPEKWKQHEEEERAKRGGGSSSGGGSSGGDAGPASDAGDGDSSGGARRPGLGEGGDSGQPYLGGADGPPPVEGEPGASKKGCNMQGEEMPGALIVALAGILGLRRRRG
jgi:outer membrane protein OmpA-like peptidoglycan-associated protein